MAERKSTKKLSTTNTKQEMLDAYNDLLSHMEEKRESDATPEQKVAEKAVKQVVEVADSLTTDGIIRDISGLKVEVGKVLANLSDRLEQETGRYEAIKRAITGKEKELAEIYEIQKAASSLSALIEAQNLKKEEFESDMADRKEALTREVEETRLEWQKERAQRTADLKEQDAAEAKKRTREKEEYDYNLQRERQAAKDAFEKERADMEEEKARIEREIVLRREQSEREFSEREQAIACQEQELVDLRSQLVAFPKELETTVAREVKQAVERVKSEAENKLTLAAKESEGERNVYETRISALEIKVRDQAEQVARLTAQTEKAYTQVQDIAVKAVEGSAAKVQQTLAAARQGE
jgi:hypothetical protein